MHMLVKLKSCGPHQFFIWDNWALPHTANENKLLLVRLQEGEKMDGSLRRQEGTWRALSVSRLKPRAKP